MRLYIPLDTVSKAVNIPNAGMETVSERRNARNYNESFTRVSPGVSGDSDAPDKPNVGAKWEHDEENSIDDDVEKDREKDKKINQSRGVVKADKKPKEATEMAKSISSSMRDVARQNSFNPLEVEFLKSHFEGCTDDDIIKGRVAITGRHRQAFNEWLCSKLVKDPNKIYRR